jgi:hypothetical protein
MASTDMIEILPIDTECFHAMPPAPRHAISTHIPGWDLTVEFSKKDPAFFAKFIDMYPRYVLHRDVKQVSAPLAFVQRESNLLTLRLSLYLCNESRWKQDSAYLSQASL